MNNLATVFLKSAMLTDSPVMPNSEFFKWINSIMEGMHGSIAQIPLNDMRQWHFEKTSGYLIHNSHKFFSVIGLRIKTNHGTINEWEQPIIDQPEIGILGILTKKINGVLHFLMQAKIEPGNINMVQLSPTLQATRSNYLRVHSGKSPSYLEYFINAKPGSILLDQLQSEQGARFYRKRNRNIIIEIPENAEVKIEENFCWLSLGQIKFFIKSDNLVNMDTRTVISGIPFGELNAHYFQHSAAGFLDNLETPGSSAFFRSLISPSEEVHSMDEIISWITRQKTTFELEVGKIPLYSVKSWINDGYMIYHQNRKYFSVIGVHVEINNREVSHWDQPMIQPAQEGIMGLLVRKIDGVYHFLVQAKLEAGNMDIIELAPTVQCLTGNYRKGLNEYEVPFLNYFLNATPDHIWHSSMQSEEGGRFFREQNRNMIVEVDDRFLINVPENFIWMTYPQLKQFLKFNNYLNIASRSLIACLDFNLPHQ